MYANDEKQLVYFNHEEHLVRRLGSALVTCWVNIPKAVQDMLLTRAQEIADDQHSECVATDLRTLLTSHY